MVGYVGSLGFGYDLSTGSMTFNVMDQGNPKHCSLTSRPVNYATRQKRAIMGVCVCNCFFGKNYYTELSQPCHMNRAGFLYTCVWSSDASFTLGRYPTIPEHQLCR